MKDTPQHILLLLQIPFQHHRTLIPAQEDKERERKEGFRRTVRERREGYGNSILHLSYRDHHQRIWEGKGQGRDRMGYRTLGRRGEEVEGYWVILLVSFAILRLPTRRKGEGNKRKGKEGYGKDRDSTTGH